MTPMAFRTEQAQAYDLASARELLHRVSLPDHGVAEQFGNLDIRQLLAVSHQQDFAVRVVELFESFQKPTFDLASH